MHTYIHIIQDVHIPQMCSLFRWDTSAPETKYTRPPPEGKLRTLTSLHQNCTFSRPDKHLGSKNPPLLQLEPSQYVLDELHLLLRVSDVLVRNLIHLADHMDQRSRLTEGRARHHVSNLEREVQSCGVSFKITPVREDCTYVQKITYKHTSYSQVQNENGKAVTGLYEWTSLTRAQILLLLQHLPSKLPSLFPETPASGIGSLMTVRSKKQM